MASEHPANGSIQELIKVTEQRARAEERVARLLQSVERNQTECKQDLQGLVEQVVAMGRCLNAVQQMLVMIAEYMAIMAVRDSDQVQSITQQLLTRSGINFGDEAQVDIGGDMVGGDQKGGD